MIRSRLGCWVVLACVTLAAQACETGPGPSRPAPLRAAGIPPVPAVILMIGDGMGAGHLEAASWFRHGQPGRLAMESLPNRGEVVTLGPNGTTDSAAAGTTMACGIRTLNGRLGLDSDGRSSPNLVERAHDLGWSAGVVTTTSLPHATPAAFTVHAETREAKGTIAVRQVVKARPEVLLGGGARYFGRGAGGRSGVEGGLDEALDKNGYRLVTDRDGLGSADPGEGGRLLGLFAPDHMPYETDRKRGSEVPSLAEMTLAAIRVLARNQRGFLLVVEGGMIDKAAHRNDLERVIGEVLAFDDAVAVVRSWIGSREDVTLIVTADHETGGLEILGPSRAGVCPSVGWASKGHSDARVPVFGQGPGTQIFSGAVIDHRWIHSVAVAGLEGREPSDPGRVAIADGDPGELRHRSVAGPGGPASGSGPGPRDLHLEADARGLTIGIEGRLREQGTALVVLLDGDFGSGSGPARLDGGRAGGEGRLDALIASLVVDASGVEGFGADLALGSVGGAQCNLKHRKKRVGLRGLPTAADPGRLPTWLPALVKFRDLPGGLDGFEAFVPWEGLYPDLGGRVPPGATLALAAMVAASDGRIPEAGALPAIRGDGVLTGVIAFTVDSDGDGLADGERPPRLVPSTRYTREPGAAPPAPDRS